MAKPFLKWAGGKRSLVPQILNLFPERIKTYYEPFLGGGAVFFALSAEGRMRRSVLNDANQDLIECYHMVRSFPDSIIKELAYDGYSNEEGRYYWYRSLDPAGLRPLKRVARMLYLNRLCFNGLYRVNKSGGFNVPFGKYKQPFSIDSDNLHECAFALQEFVKITNLDFVESVEGAGSGDLVYFDPPYYPTKPGSFTAYTGVDFGDEDHRRLAETFRACVANGAMAVLSNSDTPTVRALYKDWRVIEVSNRRSVGASGDARGTVKELIIVGGE